MKRAVLLSILVACGAARPVATPPAIVLVESVPVETVLDHPELPDAASVWLDMIRGATRSIDLAEFYASNHEPSTLEPIVGALEAAVARGVRVRFLVEQGFVKTYPDTLDRLAHAGATVRPIDWKALHGSGILHAKYFVVDDREAFLGSQNFDWRALEHNYELGARVREPAVVAGLAAIFTADWASAAPATANPPAPPSASLSPSSASNDAAAQQNASVSLASTQRPPAPPSASLSPSSASNDAAAQQNASVSLASNQRPPAPPSASLASPSSASSRSAAPPSARASGNSSAASPAAPAGHASAATPARVRLVASPPSLLPEGVAYDLPAIIALLDGARTSITVQALGYLAGDWQDLEGPLKRAAARGVHVQLLFADWSKRPKTIAGLQALARVPNIAVRLTTIPTWSGGFVPFARVTHAKALVVDGARGWLGTSNWEPDYFTRSRNVGLLVDDAALARQLARFFATLWDSPYAAPVDPDATYTPPRIAE